MRSTSTDIRSYLDALPDDRREALVTVRKTILANLPRGYEEAFNYGMIAYQVPLAVYPDTYNKQPLMYAALANQKNHMAVHLVNVYVLPALRKKLEAGFKAAGKKPDMGKGCIRFKKLADLPLDLIGELVAATPMHGFIDFVKSVPRKSR